MAEIHKLLPRTELPSWIDSVPSNIGMKSRGKLSADQWHIFCVVNLPIILIPLWAPRGGIYRMMLDNYMDLVTEVVIGGLLDMSEDVVAVYERCSRAYLETAKELYDITITPNQHNSLHIPQILRNCGPLHAIRTFFSERINYLLQRQNTNLKFGQFATYTSCAKADHWTGELELTFMRHSCRAANLRAVLDNKKIRSEVEELIDAYEHLRSEDRRGTRLRESVLHLSAADSGWHAPEHAKPVVLDDPCFGALVAFLNRRAGREAFADAREVRREPGLRSLLNRAYHIPSVQLNGVSFKSVTNSPKDSNLIFWADEARTVQAPARLQEIFTYSYRDPGAAGNAKEGMFVYITPYKSLSSAHIVFDSFRSYEHAGGRLFYDEYTPGIVIPVDSIVSHFARTPMIVQGIATPCVHVLSLDKASAFRIHWYCYYLTSAPACLRAFG